MKIFSFLFFISILIFSCDGGLDPTKVKATGDGWIKGTIRYIGGKEAWPPEDSVFAIRVVAFKNYPPGDIFGDVISGNAYFTFETLPLYVDSTEFLLKIPDAPVEIKYFAVAHQYGDSITSQQAVGVYTESGDPTKPSNISVQIGKENYITIDVDFSKLPPQPF